MKLTDLYREMEYGPAPECAAQAVQWLEEHQRKFTFFINGKWAQAGKEKHFETVNPANGEILASISEAGEKEVDQAVRAAAKAFPVWNGLDGHRRARYLYAMARQMQKHSRLL
ncbi:MAG: aldehyde dehydrogenase family protein, partial [SAR324 cluster bacterium]|nr:aldehyde dehydrogenase family protein [SAR324 cluster bacterium]